MQVLFEGRIGLEIGGPSALFSRRGLFPVYPVAARVDNCNFGRQTVWEGSIHEGRTFEFEPRRDPGFQFITEASDLGQIRDGAYDFVLSSHTLEHLANPLGALAEWSRVLVPTGTLALVVPHKEGTFDHRRPVTTLAHLAEDAERGTTEADRTHLDEILALHDLSLDPGAGDREAFESRSLENEQNRCLHHHVFDTALAAAVVDCAGFQILAVETAVPFHILVVAQKRGRAENGTFLGPDAPYRTQSPFNMDRRPTSDRRR